MGHLLHILLHSFELRRRLHCFAGVLIEETGWYQDALRCEIVGMAFVKAVLSLCFKTVDEKLVSLKATHISVVNVLDSIAAAELVCMMRM